jgi:hypothetical protein
MNKSLWSNLKVLEREKRALLGLCALFCSVFFFMALFRNYVDTTFLKRYGVQQIPLMLAINSVVTFAVIGICNRISLRLYDARLLAGVFLFYGIATGILYWGVHTGAGHVYPILFQLLYLQDSLLLVYLWNIACDIFDSRQGKRLFPLITAAQVLGTVGGNFATDGLSRFLGRDQLLLVYAGSCLVLGLVMLAHKSGATPWSGRSSQAAIHRRLAEIPALIKKYPIVRYLVMLGLLPNILLPIFLYQFSVIVNRDFASEQTLLSFFSLFRGGMTLAVFLLLLAMGRIYARIGVVNASLALPLNLGVLFTALTASFSLYTAVIGQFVTRLVQQAVAGPVNKVLFNLVPRDVAGWTGVFVRGTVVKAGMLLGSVMMLALKPVLSPRQLAPLAAVIAFYWIFETLAFRRHFRQALKQVIAHDAVDFDRIDSLRMQSQSGLDPALPLADNRDMLSEDKTAPREAVSLAVDDALAMMQDPDPLVRAQAVAAMARQRDMRAAHRLVLLLRDQDMVRQLAVGALLNYGESLQPFLEASLTDPHPRQRQGILEVVRLAGMKSFNTGPMIREELGCIYNRALAMRELSSKDGHSGLAMLRAHLEASNREGLSLIFHALWVRYKDMRLMHSALASLDASAAVELVEVTVERPLARLLIPLLEKMPTADLIALGRDSLPLQAANGVEGALMHLARSRDRITRVLAAFAMGEAAPGPVFLPAVEMLLEDEDHEVRESARYARNRCLGMEAKMPMTIELMERMKGFTLFRGLGIREFEALAAIARRISFQPGDIVVEAGRVEAALVLVLSGVLIRGQDGTEGQAARPEKLGPGDWLGDLGLFTQAEAEVTWRAQEAVEALLIPFGHLSEIMSIYPGIGLTFCRNFAARLQGKEATVAVYDPAEQSSRT